MTVGDTKPRLFIANPGYYAGQDNWSRGITNIAWSNAIPGGFGSFRFYLPWQNTNPPQGIDFAVPIIVTDEAQRTVFEGRIEDIALRIGDSTGYDIECAGWQRLLDEPYRACPILRDIAWQQRPLMDSALIRPDIVQIQIGNLDTASGSKAGVGFTVSRATVATNQLNFATFYPGAGYDQALDFRRFKCTFDLLQDTATMDFRVASIDSSGVYTNQSTGNTTSANGQTLSVALPAGTRGVAVGFVCTAGALPVNSTYVKVYNARLLGSRSGGSTDEPVYGHELVRDLVSSNALVTGGANIDTDTSYQFDQAAWLDSITGREVLDYITSFYDRYWAVWEDKEVYWKALNINQPTWIVKRSQCANGTSISGSILESARAVRVRYQTIKGLAQSREVTVNDGAVDNVFRTQGGVHTEIVDLGLVATSTTATQIGNTFFPDHSYEFMRGTIVLQALEKVGSNQWGNRPAYTMRAGEILRLQDIVSSRDLFGSTFDRKSTFIIRSVDVDWEAQTVTLAIDNQSDRLASLLSRLALGLGVRFG